jgi:hypothetical protein
MDSRIVLIYPPFCGNAGHIMVTFSSHHVRVVASTRIAFYRVSMHSYSIRTCLPYTYLCPISPISMGSHLLMSSIALKYLWFHHNMIPWPFSTYRLPVSSDIRVCVSVYVESVLCLWSTSCGNDKHVGSSSGCSIVPYGHVHTSISTYPISAVGIWAYVHLSMHTHMMQFFPYLSNICSGWFQCLSFHYGRLPTVFCIQCSSDSILSCTPCLVCEM